MWGAFKQQFTVDKQNKTSVIILAHEITVRFL